MLSAQIKSLEAGPASRNPFTKATSPLTRDENAGSENDEVTEPSPNTKPSLVIKLKLRSAPLKALIQRIEGKNLQTQINLLREDMSGLRDQLTSTEREVVCLRARLHDVEQRRETRVNAAATSVEGPQTVKATMKSERPVSQTQANLNVMQGPQDVRAGDTHQMISAGSMDQSVWPLIRFWAFLNDDSRYVTEMPGLVLQHCPQKEDFRTFTPDRPKGLSVVKTPPQIVIWSVDGRYRAVVGNDWFALHGLEFEHEEHLRHFLDLLKLVRNGGKTMAALTREEMDDIFDQYIHSPPKITKTPMKRVRDDAKASAAQALDAQSANPPMKKPRLVYSRDLKNNNSKRQKKVHPTSQSSMGISPIQALVQTYRNIQALESGEVTGIEGGQKMYMRT